MDESPNITSAELLNKAIAAAISSIELYNKPDFKYREETFGILMTNAWELLLKAKALKDSSEDFSALVVVDRDGKPKLSRSGSPITHELTYLANKLVTQKGSGMDATCFSNLELLVEIRDTSVHFVNRDIHFSRRVQDVGTAALKNFITLASAWFGADFSRFNFYLMPISFFHGFEAFQPTSISSYTEQMKRLLLYIREKEVAHSANGMNDNQITLCVKTEFSRSMSSEAFEIRLSNNPAAPELQMKEEDVRKRWPLTYDEMVIRCRQRYEGFKTDAKFIALKKQMEADGNKYAKRRFLDPQNPKPPGKTFYSPEVFNFLDKNYTKTSLRKTA